MELVRFLNRLCNKGMSLIVSTHSDTFASRVNNLYLVSKQVKLQGRKVLEELSLEAEDILAAENLFVYEFVNKPDGKSIVKEVYADSDTGYQFDLFTNSAMKLFNEAEKVGEYLANGQ